jgi:hypothetical protein
MSRKKNAETASVGRTGVDFRIEGGRLRFGEAVLKGVDGPLSLRSRRRSAKGHAAEGWEKERREARCGGKR